MKEVRKELASREETDMSEILTPEEAATRLKLHKKTVYRLLKDKKLPGARVGGSWRMTEESLRNFLNSGAKAA